MKIGKLHTLWIILISIYYIVNVCGHAIIRQLRGTIKRPWVDAKIQWWSDKILGFIKVKLTIVNPHEVSPQPGIPTIIMCNHSSLYDIPLSFKAFPNHSIRMLAKKELSNIPIMGKGMKAAEFPFIDRKNRKQAIQDLERVRDLLKSGIVMWIAPEGTRSKDGQLSTFKKGGFITAIQAKATIIPIGIRGAYDILPARTYQLNTNQSAEIHIGQPIDASQYTLEDKESLMKAVHDCMEQLLHKTP